MYDYFYDNFDEYDRTIQELEQSLKEGIKKQFIEEMDRLRLENKELREFKELRDSYEREHQEKLNKLEVERKHLKAQAFEEVRKMSIKELLEPASEAYWAVGCRNEYIHEKCDKCDGNRNITFCSPSGKQYEESCSCSEKERIYYPKEAMVTVINRDMYGKYQYGATPFFVEKTDGTIHLQTEYGIDLDCRYFVGAADDKQFTDIHTYSAVFKSKDKAQAYCDYLNER